MAAPPVAHFWLVACAALAGAIASAALTAAGVRRDDGRTVLLGTAFSTMTAMLAVHGLATPGVLAGPNGVDRLRRRRVAARRAPSCSR